MICSKCGRRMERRTTSWICTDCCRRVEIHEISTDPYEPTYDERKTAAIAHEWAKLTPNLVELALHANKIAELFQI
jgi:predicted amidophosphoribosyltransferase